jgi:hypothetical protein
MKSRIMYIESKAGGLVGPARVGRVTISKTGATLHYAGKSFQSLKGRGFKSNYYEVESGELQCNAFYQVGVLRYA